MSAPVGRILWTLVSWAPALWSAAKVWVTPVERNAKKRHERVDQDREKRERELDTVPPAR